MGSFKSFARSLRYPNGGFQTPERSGLPSGNRGAGADRFGLPSGVRGIAAGRTFVHCANAGMHVVKMIATNRNVSFIGNSPVQTVASLSAVGHPLIDGFALFLGAARYRACASRGLRPRALRQNLRL